MRKSIHTTLLAALLLSLATGLAAADWSFPQLWEHSTPGVERMPSPVGNTLTFVKDYDIYTSTYDDASGTWSEPEPVPGPINTGENEISPYVLPNGRVMYFLRYAAATNYVLYRTEWDAGAQAWGEPVHIEELSTTAQDWDIWVNEDETVAYLTTAGAFGGQESMGGRDVWKSVKENGVWQTPVNLGPPINTSGNEWSFFIGPDGAIYVDSTGRDASPSLGSYDIYRAESEHDEPLNLGFPFNSADEEREVGVSEKFFFFAANNREGGAGGYDLWYSIWE